MSVILDRPLVIFAASLLAQWLAAYIGDLFRARVRPLSKDQREDFDTIQTASLTLLAVIIGFSFSMAVTRYDQRKNYEEAEANAIGTEYLRADLLQAEDAARVRDLLKQYLDLRIAFYETGDRSKIKQIEADTAALQAKLWSVVLRAAHAQPTAVTALAVSGMNDVLNSQGYTQAAWWNRLPVAACALMVIIALACNGLIGYGERKGGVLTLAALPIIISISFLLIADIDSPRGGMIRVHPHNLIAASLLTKTP
jgi:hypothetical protein